MIKHGPVDVIVLAAGEPRFDGGVLAGAGTAGGIRDNPGAGRNDPLEGRRGRPGGARYRGPAGGAAAELGFIETGTRGLFDSEDAETLFEGMVPGSAVVALAIEHTWALALVNAVYQAGVDMALNFRVPAKVVDEAFASLGVK